MRRTTAIVIALASTWSVPVAAQTVSPVFDASNYAQNVLIAARALQQINNEVTALSNQAQVLENMRSNLTPIGDTALSGLLGNFTAVNSLLASAQTIAFRVSAMQAELSATYPDSYTAPLSASSLDADAEQRWQDAMGAFKDALTLQAKVVENVENDGS
ncbi:MAG: P-type conjugative transfer protein TrbJ, partial [Alphaproteobacteria bacterium]|nr:P-type conjugative transfer protein TrbJ [Alphaproteobacteria bacterium]